MRNIAANKARYESQPAGRKEFSQPLKVLALDFYNQPQSKGLASDCNARLPLSILPLEIMLLLITEFLFSPDLGKTKAAVKNYARKIFDDTRLRRLVTPKNLSQPQQPAQRSIGPAADAFAASAAIKFRYNQAHPVSTKFFPAPLLKILGKNVLISAILSLVFIGQSWMKKKQAKYVIGMGLHLFQAS